MNKTALKEIEAGLYASLFTNALRNFSEFLLTQNPDNDSKIRSLNQELIIAGWKIADSNDSEPQRSAELSDFKNLSNPRRSSTITPTASSRWCARGTRPAQ